jgi:hypothetical protein
MEEQGIVGLGVVDQPVDVLDLFQELSMCELAECTSLTMFSRVDNASPICPLELSLSVRTQMFCSS